ncbi:MAG: hypothetical protein A3J48_00640 [Candidatus Doudnabacteria bacterium RIFCSPHIGHO2_02_FULL_46_11]|uniref:Peptidyl-prolyl cis-trans isomerase n=1 Tax=Candidatus Doudnabacteria bacterium RIFCSPHIGHO2_02_FULL_46_11 TaxID=1817832 RepID=A0A1F5P548_9BACT|nr:MAG: hypothetical protein A3J48_00640 [Candidatus Doudnabacteria bacterium RIFCSPHIGHO2_02_FULL_46_11]
MQNGSLSQEYANKQARIKTNYGDFVVSFFDNDAPKTVENFIRLSQEEKYNNSPFHRIIKGFMIQGGDFTNGDGTGGESIYGGPFEDELEQSAKSYKEGYKRGVIAMANRGPNTNGSQFFINLVDNNSVLSKNYTIFGQVSEGMEVVDKIADIPVLENAYGELSVPTERVIIEQVTIEERKDK